MWLPRHVPGAAGRVRLLPSWGKRERSCCVLERFSGSELLGYVNNVVRVSIW